MLSEPFILEDRSRLPEIYRLRVSAYKESPFKNHITLEKYPDGYSDNLDSSGIHFVICDTNEKIIAAARLNVVNTLEELPYPGVFRSFDLPPQKPFLFYSRLVVNQEYRQLMLGHSLHQRLLKYHKQSKFSFGITTIANITLEMMIESGFEVLGIVDNKSDKNYPVADDITTYAVIIHRDKIKLL